MKHARQIQILCEWRRIDALTKVQARQRLPNYFSFTGEFGISMLGRFNIQRGRLRDLPIIEIRRFPIFRDVATFDA